MGKVKCINTKDLTLRFWDGSCPEGWTDKMPEGLLRPVWDGKKGAWVEGATDEELEAATFDRKKNKAEIFRSQVLTDGDAYFREKDIWISAKLEGLTENEIATVTEELDVDVTPALLYVRNGQWYSAKLRFDNAVEPKNEIAADIFRTVKAEIENYVSDTYQKEKKINRHGNLDIHS